MSVKRAIVFAPSSEPMAIECPPIFKIHRCPESFPRPPAYIGHYPHFLDYSVAERSGVRGVTQQAYSLDSDFTDLKTGLIPDDLVLAADAAERMDEILDVVNALASKEVIYYNGYQAWFTDLADSGDRSRYGQEFYHHPDVEQPASIDPTPDFSLLDELVLTVHAGDELIRTVRLQELLRLYFSAPDSEPKRLFRDACRVAARARRLGRFDLSTSFILLVSAIESLVHIRHRNEVVDRCAECGQDKYRVVRKFQDFLDEYCFQIDKKTKSRLYGLRSALVHRGQFLPLDDRFRFYVESADDLRARLDATV